jgi:hypothetical protein
MSFLPKSFRRRPVVIEARVPWELEKKARALRYLAEEEHVRRCMRAAVQRNIAKASALGRIGQR